MAANPEETRGTLSWQDIRTRFLGGAQGHPELWARWDGKNEVWILCDATLESEQLFEEIAQSAVRLLRDSSDPDVRARASSLRKPWYVWLDLMRDHQRGYRLATRRRRRAPGSIEEYRGSLSALIGRSISGIPHLFKESADFCVDLRSHMSEAIPTQQPSGDNPLQRLATPPMAYLPELPLQFQNAFEAAKAKTELEYTTRTQCVAHNSQEHKLCLMALIHSVFFEFCTQARSAWTNGDWTSTDVRKAAEVAGPIICDFYFLREGGPCPEELKLTYRAAAWSTAVGDARWREHLSELAASNSSEPASPEVVVASALSELTPEAHDRIERALQDANAYPEDANAAMLHYFDAMAWEYISTRPGAAFATLIDAIGEKARSVFDGDAESLSERKQYWMSEARERDANGIVGGAIPLRINPHHAKIFGGLQIHFRELPDPGPDLRATFNDGGKCDIRPGPDDPAQFRRLRRRFERLARHAMVALGFHFSDQSRSVYYWLGLLRQENPHLSAWLIPRLCFECAEFCFELRTRALEVRMVSQTDKNNHGAAGSGTNGNDPGPSADMVNSPEPILRISQNARPTEMAQRPGDVTPGPEAVNWEEIEIRFLSDERVQITAGESTETRNYSEFGFEDSRSEKPNRAWGMLRSLAERGGTIHGTTDTQEWTKVEKRIQEIRKHFRAHFRIEADPLPWIPGTGYRARFKIRCAASFDS